MRIAGHVLRIGVAFALVFLVSGAAMASDVEQRIPVVRDAAGSGLTTEISREGARRTATLFLTLNDPTVLRIEERIGKKIDRLTQGEAPSTATAGNARSRVGPAGTPQVCSRGPETSLSSPPPVPREITVRSARDFLKALRALRKLSLIHI